jgi:large subunit ribosomal protein L22
MQFSAKTRFARITPRKLRYVVNLIRGKDYNSAMAILRVIPKRGTYFVTKVLKSAMDNATSIIRDKNLNVDVNKLHIVKAWVDQGPMFKRWRPASMGRAVQIRKRSSHLNIVLEEREPRESKKERIKRQKEEQDRKGKSITPQVSKIESSK